MNARYTATHDARPSVTGRPRPPTSARSSRNLLAAHAAPFQLNHINLWLLEDGDGWTIVDTGVGLDDTRALWERIFAAHLGGRPVRRVLVTHFHPDHMGNAGWLTARWKTELWCTQAEWLYAQFAWRSRGAADFEPRLAHFRRHGCGPEALVQLGRRGNHYPSLVPEVSSEFRRIREADALTIGRRTFRVLIALGHAPEHACLWDEAGRLLIAGDQVLPKITTNVSVWSEQPGLNPLRLYLDSLDRFEPMAPDSAGAAPSHGLPFRGLHARLGYLRDHHAARLNESLGCARRTADRGGAGAGALPARARQPSAELRVGDARAPALSRGRGARGPRRSTPTASTGSARPTARPRALSI